MFRNRGGDGYLKRRRRNGVSFIQGRSNHACSQRLAEEQVIHHLAVDGGKLGLAGNLALAAGYGFRKLLLAVNQLPRAPVRCGGDECVF
jgi:hypothetical protein